MSHCLTGVSSPSVRPLRSWSCGSSSATLRVTTRHKKVLSITIPFFLATHVSQLSKGCGQFSVGGGAHYRGRRKQTLISSLLTFGRLLIIPVSTLGCEARRRKNGTHAETKIGSKEYLFNSRLNGNPCWILSTKYVNLQACYICKTAPLLGSTFEDFCTFAIQRCNWKCTI